MVAVRAEAQFSVPAVQAYRADYRLLWALGLLLVAAWLRFWRLDVLPPGMISDIAVNGLDIRDVLAGQLQVFFPANNGREALFIYFQALLVAGAGNAPFVYAYSALAMGMLTVALSYRLLRSMFGSRIAWLAAMLLAGSFWMVAMSRVGLRTTSLPPFMLATLYCLWRVLRTGRWHYAAFCGVALGGALYTYIAGRLLPLLMVLICLAEWSVARKRWRQLALAAVVALAVFAPEGAYFLSHPEVFASRTEAVSVFNEHPEIEGVFKTPQQSVLDTAGMFFVHGDSNQRYNIPGRPLFDPLLGALFAAGLAGSVWLSRRDERYHWLLLWLVVMLLPSALSHESPYTFRVLSAAPVIYALPALGLSGLLQLFRRQHLSAVLSLLIAAWWICWTLFLYFGQWARDAKTYDAYAGGVTKLASFVAQRPERHLVLAYHNRWPVEVITPRSLEGQWLAQDTADVPIPSTPDGDTLYVVSPSAALNRLDSAPLPGLVRLEHPIAPTGMPDFLAYAWPAAATRRFLAGLEPLDVAMEPDVRLIGCSATQGSDSVTFNLVWRPEQLAGPYDLYVHLLDASGKQIGQSDVLARPPEDGPTAGYVLLTQHVFPRVPEGAVAAVGAAHRSSEHPEQVVGGSIGAEARLKLAVQPQPACSA